MAEVFRDGDDAEIKNENFEKKVENIKKTWYNGIAMQKHFRKDTISGITEIVLKNDDGPL